MPRKPLPEHASPRRHVAIFYLAVAGALALGWIATELSPNHGVGQRFRRMQRSVSIAVKGHPRNSINETSKEAETTTISNKTLVILMGNIRGGERAWQSLYENVLDINDADLALAVGWQVSHNISSLYGRSKYLWEFPEHDNWTPIIDQSMSIHTDGSWQERILGRMTDTSTAFGGCNDIKGSGCVIFWIRWFISTKIKQLKLTEKYERFVLTRPDHFYLCPHNLSELDSSMVWIPKGQDFGGIMDRHLIAPAFLFLETINILPPVIQHPELYPETVLPNGIGAENLLRIRFEQEGIQPQRFPTCFFTVVEEGDPTRTHWAQRRQRKSSDGLLLKYPEEYLDSQTTCFGKQVDPTYPI